MKIPSFPLKFAAAAIALGALSSAFAVTITLTPSTPALLKGNDTSEGTIAGIIAAAYPTVDQLYKATRSDGSEAGALAGSYATDFSNPAPLVPSSALITYTGGATFNSSPAYAFIRDGSYTNYNWYLFDISGWNGTDSVAFSGFFPLDNGGSQNISHVALFGTTSSNVPDGGATILLLGAGLAALAVVRRKLSLTS